MTHPGWTVRTGRLLLEPVSWRDLQALEALKADPAVFAQMLGGVRSPAQTAHELAEDVAFWGKHEVGMWAVRAHGQHGVLGITGIHERPDGRGFGLRFAFTPGSRGNGYAREAAGAALRFAHEEGELPRVVAVTKEENFDSRTVLGAIGMRPAGRWMRGSQPMLTFVSERPVTHHVRSTAGNSVERRQLNRSPLSQEKLMSDVQNDAATELFITGLRNQHAVENQAVSLLSRQVERLENYPEMEARMRQHIDESKVQAERIEELLSKLGASHSSLKDAGLSFMGNMAALAHTAAQDEVLKNTLANFAFEHFEIASYKSLLALADHVGQGSAQSALQQSLSEEVSMAQWIDQHIGDTTLRYLKLSQSGHKAGV